LGLSLVSTEDHKLAKPNYQFEKRKREIEKKAKKEQKKLRKLRPSGGPTWTNAESRFETTAEPLSAELRTLSSGVEKTGYHEAKAIEPLAGAPVRNGDLLAPG
jgi:hypothetical protein